MRPQAADRPGLYHLLDLAPELVVPVARRQPQSSRPLEWDRRATAKVQRKEQMLVMARPGARMAASPRRKRASSTRRLGAMPLLCGTKMSLEPLALMPVTKTAKKSTRATAWGWRRGRLP